MLEFFFEWLHLGAASKNVNNHQTHNKKAKHRLHKPNICLKFARRTKEMTI